MQKTIQSLVFILLIVASAPSFAAKDASLQRDYWRKIFSEKRAEVIDAKEQLEAAKAARREQRRRDYPGGKAKVAIDQAVTEKRKQLEIVAGEYRRLFEDAHKQGAEPGWYRDFEDELPTLIGEIEVDTEEQFPDETQFPEETKESTVEEPPIDTLEPPPSHDDDVSIEPAPEEEPSEPVEEEPDQGTKDREPEPASTDGPTP